MRSSARAGWRVAGAVAFAATAAVAVILSRAAPVHVSLASASGSVAAGSGAAAHRGTPMPRCATSGLAIRVGGTGRTLRYRVEFTNVSRAACTISGYPWVAAYGARGMQLGSAAARDRSQAGRPVVLAPGASAQASVLASAGAFRAYQCRPVTAAGLHVVPPGETAGRYVRHALPACAGHWNFLRVWPVQPGPATPVAR